MNYFKNIKTLDELKAAYRRLVMQHHPDRGGDTATMQQINAEYDELHEVLKNKHNATADEFHQTTETPEEFRQIIELLLKLQGLTVELCGSWLWISGDTLQHKDKLKAAGCRWSASKKMWYWRHAEESQKWHRGKSTINEIRYKYGSQVITEAGETTGYTRLAGATA